MAENVITPEIRGNLVAFRHFAPRASMVNVLGNFNHWNVNQGVMERRADGWWTRSIDVPLEGSYDYKFMVDGEWVLDPLNPDYGKDAKDRYNSRFQITTSASAVDHLRALNAGLAAHPAGCGRPERLGLFRAADRILQLPTAQHNRVIKEHFIERLNILAAELGRKDRSFVANVYCHGHLLQRAGSTIGIDVVTTRSVYGMYWDIPAKTVEALANGIDCLLVSHLHPDHLDALLIKHLLARHAPVFVPAEVTGRLGAGVIPVEPDRTVEFKGWKITLHRGAHVYDERKMLILRYFELVDPDGFRTIHTTDHDYTTGIRHGGPIDLLVAKAGGVNPAYEGKGKDAFLNLLEHLKPRRFIPGHLNELGHAVRGGREPYQTAIEIAQGAGELQGDLLHWGECWRIME